MENDLIEVETLAVAPNENDVVTPQIESYVDRYRAFAMKTAVSILGLAETLVSAEAELNAVDFAVFCRQIGLSVDSATFAKLKRIGTCVERFKPFVESLPNSWTTIYKLSKLDAAVFDRISSDLSPFITASKVDQLVAGGEVQRSSAHNDIIIDTSPLGLVAKQKLYDALTILRQEHAFKLKESRSFANSLAEAKLISINEQEIDNVH